MTALVELEAFVRGTMANRNQNPQALRDAADVVNVIHKAARQDPDPTVAAWAALAEFTLLPAEADRISVIRDLLVLNNPGQWPSRQIALVLVPAVTDRALVRMVLDKLASDPQPTVAAMANAERGLLDRNVPLDGHDPAGPGPPGGPWPPPASHTVPPPAPPSR